MTTSVDCPRGSGLGASSALVVAMVEALRAWQGVDLTPLQSLISLMRSSGWTSEWPAGGRTSTRQAVGGVNFMEFASRERVLVNPLALPAGIPDELESSLLLCFTGVSRFSSEIIEQQVKADQWQRRTPAWRQCTSSSAMPSR